MLDVNEQLTGLLYAISALEPESDTAEAHAVYFQQIAMHWFQAAALLAAESVASREPALRSQAALELRGVKNGQQAQKEGC